MSLSISHWRRIVSDTRAPYVGEIRRAVTAILKAAPTRSGPEPYRRALHPCIRVICQHFRNVVGMPLSWSFVESLASR